MTSVVDLCNRALGAIASRSTISSITEASVEANECNRWYDTSRQAALRSHNWGFARRTAVLTLLRTAPGVDSQAATNLPWSFMPWAYEYAYPSDCLKFRHIVSTVPGQPLVPRPWLSGFPPVRWEMSADLDTNSTGIRVLLTDQPTAVGVYTYDCANPDMFDELYMDALVYSLAGNLAMPVSGNPTIANGMRAKASEAVQRAMMADGNEGMRTQNTTPDWIGIRGTSVEDTGAWWWTSPTWPFL